MRRCTMPPYKLARGRKERPKMPNDAFLSFQFVWTAVSYLVNEYLFVSQTLMVPNAAISNVNNSSL